MLVRIGVVGFLALVLVVGWFLDFGRDFCCGVVHVYHSVLDVVAGEDVSGVGEG